MPDRKTSTIDSQNRHIEQEAQTDTDLEAVVPPSSPFGGLTTWWRFGAAAFGLLVIALVLSQAF